MTPDQFRVFEHLSYEIMATAYAVLSGRTVSDLDAERMFTATKYSIPIIHCRSYLFPDYQFNQQEFANR